MINGMQQSLKINFAAASEMNVLKSLSCLFERQSRESDLHVLVHSPGGHDDWGWSRPKPGDWSSIQVSLVGASCPSTWPTTASRGAGLEVEHLRLELALPYGVPGLQGAA